MPNIADYLNKRDLETIGRFTATWAVFEQELFSKKCGMWKIRSVISENEIADMTLQSLVQQLKNELFSYTNGTDECISALQFRNSETDENAKEQTHKWLSGEILCTYQLSVYIIFRIRCNMFHGEKMLWNLQQQEYQEMVNAVEAQKYSECIDIWDKFNTDGFYALDYKDISDYYYYADGMKLYTSSEEVKLSDIMGSFEQVSNGFRDVDFIIAGIKQQEELTNGEYHNSSEYRMTIDNGHVKVKGPSWDYFENYNGDGEYLIQDGKIQKLQVSIESMLNICNLDITFDNGSIFVKCSIPPREDMQSTTGINRSYASSVEHNLSGTCTKAG